MEAASVQRKVEAKAGAGSVRRGGDTTVRELIVMLKLLFRYAVKKKATTGVDSSPADPLDAEDFGVPPPSKRQRFLSDAEMAAFLTSRDVDLPGLLAGSPYSGLLPLSTRSAMVVGMHLGLRPAALVGSRWDELDLDGAVLHVPASRSKMAQHLKANAPVFRVPLPPTVLSVLRALKAAAGIPEWVFPSPDSERSQKGHLAADSLADAYKRLTSQGGRLQLEGGPVRPHDARRTLASAAQRLKVEHVVIRKMLQHSLGRIGDTYLPDDTFERRRTAAQLVDAHWRSTRGEATQLVPICAT